jgi:hypothetical protein
MLRQLCRSEMDGHVEMLMLCQLNDEKLALCIYLLLLVVNDKCMKSIAVNSIPKRSSKIAN